MITRETRTGPRIKICGLTRPEDARTAVEAGADYLGAILSPGFFRSVEAGRAADFVTDGPSVLVGVLVDPSLQGAVSAARVSGAGVLQLHGDEPPSLLEDLRREGPWKIWKAVQIRSAEGVVQALQRYGGVADGLLLDGWHAGRGGGVGAAFPWGRVEAVRDDFPDDLTFVAAGGLDPDNVAEVVRRLRPDVVDVSSGVESERGIKDSRKVRRFVRNAKAGGGS